MPKSILPLVATAILTIAGSPALAQQAQGTSSSQAASSPPPFELPSECREAGQPSSAPMMQGMQGMQGMMGNMSEAQKGYMQAMMRMHEPMMHGSMMKDADVAWACAMIPHHMGAIEMSKVLLKTGDNPELKKMAEKSMKEQEKEISDLKEWLKKSAKK